MKKTLFSILAAFALHFTAQAQSVAINTSGNAADNSAILDVSSTDRGVLVPRLTTTQRTGISTPATGLLVYDTDLNSFYFYSGSAWTAIPNTTTWTTSGSNQYNALSGNVGIGTTSPTSLLHLGHTGTSPSLYLESGSTQFPHTLFIAPSTHTTSRRAAMRLDTWAILQDMNGSGTKDFTIYQTSTGQHRMSIRTDGNVGIGTNTPTEKLDVSGKTKTTTFQLTNGATNGYVLQSDASGNGTWVANNLSALRYVGTSYLGQTSGAGSTGTSEGTSSNRGLVAIGNGALNANTTGENNIALGYQALNANTTGTWNIAIGKETLKNNTTGELNTAIGSFALQNNTSGFENVAIGQNALDANTTGFNNLGIGNGSLNNNTTGSYNIAVGKFSLRNNTAGNNNIAVGYQAGNNNNGNGNIFIGYEAGYNETGFDKLYIANSNTSSPLLYGDFGTKTLTINDNLATKYFKMTNGATNGYVLQSDASGNGTWVNPTTFGTGNWTTSGSNQYNALSGNVGIGTTSPTEKLEVSGKTKTTNFQLTNGATNGYVLKSDATGNGTWADLNNLLGLSGVTTNYTPKWNGSNLSNSLVYDNTYTVGIKTTTFSSALLPNGSSLALGAISSSEGGQLQLNHGTAATQAYYIDTYNDLFRIASGTNTASTDIRMVINDTGNVGIGTSSPTEKLEVSGKTKTTNFQLTNGATNGYVLKSDATGNGTWADLNNLLGLSGVTTNYTPKWNGSNLSNSLVYDNTYTVGIKTTTFSSAILPNGSSLALGAISSSEGGQLQLNHGTAATQAYYIDTYNDLFRIASGTNTASSDIRMVINDTGNVGIGTTSPTEKLEVSGKTKTTNFQLTNGASNGYLLQSDASGNASWVAAVSSASWTVSGSNQYNALSGNLGVGIASPTTKLHVVGNSTLAGQVNFNNSWNIQTGADLYLEKSGTRFLTVYGTGGNVGIGTNTPTEKLEVAGALMLSSSSANSDFLFNTATRSTIYPNGTNTPADLGLQVRSKGTGALLLNGDNAGNVEIAAGGGSVGIGTTAPNSKMHINGSVSYSVMTINTSSNATSLGANDYMIIYSGSTSGNTINLPTASTCVGRAYMIVNHSTSSVLVTDTYVIANGTATPVVTAGSKVQVVSDGSSWHKMN